MKIAPSIVSSYIRHLAIDNETAAGEKLVFAVTLLRRYVLRSDEMSHFLQNRNFVKTIKTIHLCSRRVIFQSAGGEEDKNVFFADVLYG